MFVARGTETRAGRRRPRPLTTLQGQPVDAVYFRSQRAMIDERERLRGTLGVAFESDVKPADRFLMERFVTGSMHAGGHGGRATRGAHDGEPARDHGRLPARALAARARPRDRRMGWPAALGGAGDTGSRAGLRARARDGRRGGRVRPGRGRAAAGALRGDRVDRSGRGVRLERRGVRSRPSWRLDAVWRTFRSPSVAPARSRASCPGAARSRSRWRASRGASCWTASRR